MILKLLLLVSYTSCSLIRLHYDIKFDGSAFVAKWCEMFNMENNKNKWQDIVLHPVFQMMIKKNSECSIQQLLLLFALR